MKKIRRFSLFIFLLSLGLVGCERQEKSKEESGNHKAATLEYQKKEGEIVKTRSKNYEEALNKRDADILMDFWAEEAVYRNPLTGELVNGKPGIKKEYQKVFDRMKGASLKFSIRSIEFPFDDKAVEEGTVKLMRPGKDPIESDYKIVYVKKEGVWKILNVSRIDFGVLD